MSESNRPPHTQIPGRPRDPAPQGTKAPAIFNGSTHWYGYEDEAAIQAKADFVRANGFGGAIVFALTQSDFTQTGPGTTGVTVNRNPLLDAAKRYFLGRLPNPAPRNGSLARFAATAGSSGTVNSFQPRETGCLAAAGLMVTDGKTFATD